MKKIQRKYLNFNNRHKTKYAGAKTIVDIEHQKYLLWNDWPITETKDNKQGDILGSGAWGKIVVFNNKTVVKLPTQPTYCIGFEHEHNILHEVKKIKNPIVNILSTHLSAASYGNERIRGKVELIKQKYKSTSDAELQNSCIFFMERIYPPSLNNLMTITNEDKQSDLIANHTFVVRPYYIFLGRLNQWSVVGKGSRSYDIGILSLSELTCVTSDNNVPHNIMQIILQDYSGSGCVVTNYSVNSSSFVFRVGTEMCKYIWDVFIKKKIILYDTEFVYGSRTGDRSSKVFMIDCNLCQYINTPIGNVVKSGFVNCIAAAMELRLPSVNPMHWGGFLPNPLLSPNFAIECLYSMVDFEKDTFEVLMFHAQFIISLFDGINTLLSDIETKGVISKHEHDIKHLIFNNQNLNAMFHVNIQPFTSLPETHDDAIGIEKQVKIINNKLASVHDYFTRCYNRSYLLEIALAAGKHIYRLLVSADNITYISSIVSARVSYWLLSQGEMQQLFLPISIEENNLYNKTSVSISHVTSKKKHRSNLLFDNIE